MRPDLRLAPAAAVCWLTAALAIAAPSLAGWCALGAGVVALMALAAAIRLARAAHERDASASPRHARPRTHEALAAVAVALVGAALALGSVAGHAPARHPPALDRFVGSHALTIDAAVASGGRLVASGGAFDRRERYAFDATASAIVVGERRLTGSVPVVVFADDRPPELGARIRVTGTAKPNPPEDDAALLVFADEVRQTDAAPPWLAWANALRAGFAKAAADLPGDGGSLLPGLAIGDESGVPADLDSAMKASSLSHLTAVSGANCAVIVGGALALLALVGVPLLWRLVAAGVALAGFVVLVTPGASVLRAAVMAAVLLVATAAGRPRAGVPSLCLAVIGLVAVDPWLARDYGFALSVLATAGLLLLAGPLAERMQRLMPRWLALGLAVPIAAQLACQPVLILLSPTVPLYGIVANVLAEPAAPVATVVGLIGCLALPLLPPIGHALLWLGWLPASWIAGVARTASTLPGAAVPWLGGAAGVLLAAGVLASVAVFVARGPGLRRARLVVAGATAAALVASLAASAGPAIARRLSLPRDWVVAACDIGQGDAVLVRSGASVALVDTGPEPKPLAHCLGQLGIRRIDLLVLTHYDLDHVGGTDALIGRVGTALVDPPPDQRAERRIQSLVRGGASVHVATRGDAGTLGGLAWRVLWPDPATALTSSNERGVALLFDGGGVRMLFLADLDEAAQNAMLAENSLGRVDIVKVAHHGSADQSDRLYETIGARVGIISCGAGNDYGHPTRHALDLLRASGTLPARTDLEGLSVVSATIDGGLSIWTERAAAPGALWQPARR